MAPFRFERFQVEKGMLRGIEGATKSYKIIKELIIRQFFVGHICKRGEGHR